MKKLALVAALLLSVLTSPFASADITTINDLALIYIGSQHRPAWTKERLRPYVVHEYADGRKSWMFDGFLMIEFTKWNANGVQVGFGEFNGQASQKQDWLDLLETQLGLDTGNTGCVALDNLIEELIPVLGKPGCKHRVVLTMPSAEMKSGKTWGELNGSQLNFNNTNDRILAQKWYCDQIIQRFKDAHFKNLELAGIYWVKESIWDDVRSVVVASNQYFTKTRNLEVFWIPYFNAKGWDQWKDVGITTAYLQPNYFFRNTTPHSQLEQAVENAYNNDLGLEMEFEGYNFSWDPATKTQTKIKPANSALYSHSPEFYQRMVDYVDYFEKMMVFEILPIAYYSGFQGVYDLMKSGNSKDREIMDRLALLMNKRHVINGWDKEPSAGIDEVTTGDNAVAYAVDGGIYISDSAAGPVNIYTVDGRQVYARNVERMFYGEIVPCAKGVYVVRCGGNALKIAVK